MKERPDGAAPQPLPSPTTPSAGAPVPRAPPPPLPLTGSSASYRMRQLRQRIGKIYESEERPRYNCHDAALRAAASEPVKSGGRADSGRAVAGSGEKARRGEGVPVSARSRDAGDGGRTTGRQPPASFTEHELEQFGYDVLLLNPLLLLRYLRLVQQHPERWRALAPPPSPGVGLTTAANRRLQRHSRAFHRGHHGFGRRDTPVQTASYDVACSHPPRHRCRSDTSPSTPRNPRSATKPPPPTREAKAPHGVKHTPSEAAALASRLETSRTRAEDWLGDLTTKEVLAVRQLCLRELREEAGSLSEWWSAHRYCRYLRVRGRKADLYIWDDEP